MIRDAVTMEPIEGPLGLDIGRRRRVLLSVSGSVAGGEGSRHHVEHVLLEEPRAGAEPRWVASHMPALVLVDPRVWSVAG
jgi:hypothetical protein